MSVSLTAEQHLKSISAIMQNPRADVAVESQGLYGLSKFTHTQRDGEEVDISCLIINEQNMALASEVVKFLHSNEIWVRDSVGLYTSCNPTGDKKYSGLYYALDLSGKKSIETLPSYIKDDDPYKGELEAGLEKSNAEARQQGANSVVFYAAAEDEPIMLFLRNSDLLKLERCLQEQDRGK